MTGTPSVDAADWRRSIGAQGLLREFNEAGVLEGADVLVAQRLTSLAGEHDDRVALAVALVGFPAMIATPLEDWHRVLFPMPVVDAGGDVGIATGGGCGGGGGGGGGCGGCGG